MHPPELDRKYNILVGSVRSAKTWAVTAKVILHLCRYKVEGRRVIIGKSKGKVHKNILIDLFEIIGKDKYSYNQSTGELWLFLGENGAGVQWFVIGANDEASYTNILGMTIGVAIGDEVIEWPRSFFFVLMQRLSPKGSRFYGTTNPGPPTHYLKTEVIDGKSFKPDLTHIEFTLDDNPNLDPNSKRTIKASQSGVFFLRYILGRWVAAEGAIYGSAWSSDLIYHPEEIGPGLYGFGGYVDHIVFMDYGTANPCTALEAIDDGKTLWIDRQYWWDSAKEMRQKTDSQYKDDIVCWLSPDGYKNTAGIVSVSRVQRRSQPRIVLDPSAASFRNELSAANLWVVDANNDVLDGIRKTSSVLTQRRIRISAECEELIRELPSYMWDPDAIKRGEEAPIKTNDHGCDALRYGVEEVFSDYRLLAA